MRNKTFLRLFQPCSLALLALLYFSAIEKGNGQSLYFRSIINEAKQDTFPLRLDLLERLSHQDSIVFDLYSTGWDLNELFTQQVLLPIVKDYPEKIKFNQHYLAIKNPDGTFTSRDGQGSVEELKRQLAIQEIYPEKFHKYLLERAQFMAVNFEDEIELNWTRAVDYLGMDSTLLAQKAESQSIKQQLESKILQSIQDLGIPNLVEMKYPVLLLDGEEFTYMMEDPVEFPEDNRCCDQLLCLARCTEKSYLEIIQILMGLGGSDRAATLFFLAAEADECLQTCTNPLTHCSEHLAETDPIYCKEGKYCYNYENTYQIAQPVGKRYLFRRAICTACPEVKLFPNDRSVSVELYKPEIEQFNGFLETDWESLGISFEGILNGESVFTENLLLGAPDKTYVDYVHDLTFMQPGDEFCITQVSRHPEEMLGDCPSFDKCIRFECPQVKMDYNKSTGDLNLNIHQNEDLNFTMVKYFINIERPGEIPVSETGRVYDTDWETTILNVDNVPAGTKICLTYETYTYAPYPGTGEIMLDCSSVFSPKCFTVGEDELCFGFEVELVACKQETYDGSYDGWITVDGHNGYPPYTFEWNDDNSTYSRTIEGLKTGQTQCVTITDSEFCQTSDCITINNDNCPCDEGNRPAEGLKPGDCLDLELIVNYTSPVGSSSYPDGSITVDATGVPGPYIYIWSDLTEPFHNKTRSNLPAGEYCVTVTPADGQCCFMSECVVMEPDVCRQNPLVLNFTTITDCGNQGGSATAVVSGGTSPYTYDWWRIGATSQTINGLEYGTYIVTVRDANGCETTGSVVVNGKTEDPIVVTADITPADRCWVGEGGSIDLTISSTMDIVYYTWSTGAHTEDIHDVRPNNYSVTITNECGNFKVYSYTVPGSESFWDYLNLEVRDICQDGFGLIGVYSPGGFSFEWRKEIDGPIISTQTYIHVQDPGIYYLTAKHFGGCKATRPIEVKMAPPMTLEVYKTPALDCSEGEDLEYFIDLEVIGGEWPLRYSWSTGQTTQDIFNNKRGHIYVWVRDANNCGATTSFNAPIIEVPPIVADIATRKSCFGENDGKISVSVNRQVFYQLRTETGEWVSSGNSDEFVIDGLSPGIYNLTLVDENGCEYSYSEVIDKIEPPEIEILEIVPVCDNIEGDGEIRLSISPAPSSVNFYYGDYTLNGTEFHATNLLLWENMQIKIKYYDSGKWCEFPYYITVPMGIQVSGEVIYNCDEGSDIILDVTGGTPPYSFQWNNGSTEQNQFGLENGTYTVTIIDAEGCSTFPNWFTFVVKDHVISSQVVNTCDNLPEGAIDISIQPVSWFEPPFTYEWSNGATTEDLMGIKAGFYYLTVTSGNGCQSIASIYVRNLDEEISPVSFNIIHTCGNPNGSITLSAAEGVTYSWNTGETSNAIHDLAPGFYSVTLTGQNGCTKVLENLEIKNDGFDIITDELINSSACDEFGVSNSDGSINISMIGGVGPYTFIWSNGAVTEDISFLAKGNYSVTVTDSRGCQVSEEFEIECCRIESEYGSTTASHIGVKADIQNLSARGASDGSIWAIPISSWGDVQYYWTDEAGNYLGNTATINNLSAGNYYVTVQDGCSTSSDWWPIRFCDDVDWSLELEIIDPCENPLTRELYSLGKATAVITGINNAIPPVEYIWPAADWPNQSSVPLEGHSGSLSLLVRDKGQCELTAVEWVYNGFQINVLNYAECFSANTCNGRIVETHAVGGIVVEPIESTGSPCGNAVIYCSLAPDHIMGSVEGVVVDHVFTGQGSEENCFVKYICGYTVLDSDLEEIVGSNYVEKLTEREYNYPCDGYEGESGSDEHDFDGDGIRDLADKCPFSFHPPYMEYECTDCDDEPGKDCAKTYYCYFQGEYHYVPRLDECLEPRPAEFPTCCTQARPVPEKDPKGVEEIYVRIYPNPFGNSFTVEIDSEGDLKNCSFSLFNVLGKQVKKVEKNVASGQQRILMAFDENLPSGSYYLIVTGDGGNLLAAERLIKINSTSTKN